MISTLCLSLALFALSTLANIQRNPTQINVVFGPTLMACGYPEDTIAGPDREAIPANIQFVAIRLEFGLPD